jgi:hypothetical protein
VPSPETRAQRRECGAQIEPKSIAGIFKELEQVHPGAAADAKIDDAKVGTPGAMATCLRKVMANRALAITFHTVADITWGPITRPIRRQALLQQLLLARARARPPQTDCARPQISKP